MVEKRAEVDLLCWRNIRMKAPGWIITIAISILMAAVLELNKNTLFGWLLLVIALAGMAVISRKYMGTWSWWKKALSIAAYMAVCVGIVFITWPPVKRVPAADTANPPRTEVYSTAYGDVRGRCPWQRSGALCRNSLRCAAG